MTSQQFFFANILKKLGIQRKQKRLQAAATELQLLREAEEILGRSVWTKVKELEHYKVNYWEINNLLHERAELTKNISEIKTKIENIKQNQENRFRAKSTPDHDIETNYQKQKDLVDELKKEQINISDIAANIKRSYDGSAAKLEALNLEKNINQAEIDKEKIKINQLKDKFSHLKEKKADSDRKLAKQTAILSKITESFELSKRTYKDTAAGNYEIMGKANKAISAYRSKIGLLDNKIIDHYNEIGKHISKECFTDKECRKAVKGKFNLCKVMQALRQSIDFNHTLADR